MRINLLVEYAIVKIEQTSNIHFFNSSTFLKAAYLLSIGHELNLNNPHAFTEKIQWLKIFDKDPIYTSITDKYQVREYIRQKIGEDYIIPLLGVWMSPKDVNLETLPQKVVFKCTHDCGSVVVYDKSQKNWKSIRKNLKRCLKRNFYYIGREWAYKDILPRIIAEPYLEDSDGKLWDYKFFCFGGKAKFFKIDFDRFVCHRANYYDIEGKYLDFGEEDYPRDPNRNITIPKELPQMVKIAERLSEGFRFLRVDMYNIDGVVKVGELSVYPGSGFLRYDPDEWDYKIGDMLALPVDNSNY